MSAVFTCNEVPDDELAVYDAGDDELQLEIRNKYDGYLGSVFLIPEEIERLYVYLGKHLGMQE
jgi:hypothetical protein